MFSLIPSQEKSLLILKMDNGSPPNIFAIVDFLASINKESCYMLSAVFFY